MSDMKMAAVSDDGSIETPQDVKPLGIAYMIGRLDRSISRLIRAFIAPYGITISQYTALSVFNKRGQLSNAQLAERTMVSPQAANELIKAMEKKGWIERQPDPTHGRVIQISLTEAGNHILEQCNLEIRKLEIKMLDEFTEANRSALKSQLRSLLRNLSELY